MFKRVPSLRIAPSLDKAPLVTFLAGLLFMVTPSDAQAPPDWMVCTGKVPVQPDRQVAACTALIEAGRETAANLAVVYCARGVALQARDMIGPAITDYDGALLQAFHDDPRLDIGWPTPAPPNTRDHLDALERVGFSAKRTVNLGFKSMPPHGQNHWLRRHRRLGGNRRPLTLAPPPRLVISRDRRGRSGRLGFEGLLPANCEVRLGQCSQSRRRSHA